MSINASDFIQVNGESANPQDFSRLTTRTEDSGDAGNLTITTSKFIVQKRAQVSTGTRPRSTGKIRLTL
ncbi:hypothetical protein [uncultured Nostoc sp.]|uniref:hypothetical protein n=1 Tax=uncultured Nostoc sp. TaxID=340711 RepID=UPI002620C35C|nr:hypothetical protein [uncultured Nostoc sp.]